MQLLMIKPIYISQPVFRETKETRKNMLCIVLPNISVQNEILAADWLFCFDC